MRTRPWPAAAQGAGVTLRRVLLASACLLLAVALGSTPAYAGTTHLFTSSFDGSETPEGAFRFPASLAVNRGTHTLYLLDGLAEPHETGAVDVFTETGSLSSQITGAETPGGNFEGATAVAVDNSGGVTEGRIYVAVSRGEVDAFDQAGKYLFAITASEVPGEAFEPIGLGVDAAGDIYVINGLQAAIDKFATDGHFISAISGPDLDRPQQIALDAGGNIDVVDGAHVSRFSSSGEELSELEPESQPGQEPAGVSVDPVTNDVYVVHSTFVNEYSDSGAFVSRFGAPNLQGAAGLAADGGQSFVLDRNVNRVAIFGPEVPAPDAETGVCTGVGQTEATFTGVVNPASELLTASYQFDYGTTTEYGSLAPATPEEVGFGTSPQRVGATIPGLTPSTTYHYRLVAFGSNGSRTEGVDRTCKTPGPPSVSNVAVSEITPTEALLTAAVSPQESDTRYMFEYGQTPAYSLGSVPVSGEDLGAADHPEAVQQRLTGLSPDTTYHFRVTAVSVQGTVHSLDGEFTTFASPGGLPDGRVYEQVSPVNKEDGEVYTVGQWVAPGNSAPEPQPFQSSPDGNEVSYEGDASSEGTGLSGNEYLSTRTTSGWSARDITPSFAGFNGSCQASVGGSPRVTAFSATLDKTIVATVPNEQMLQETGAPPCFFSLFVRDNQTNTYSALIKSAPPSRTPREFGYYDREAGTTTPSTYTGATPDLSRVFFTANAALVAPAQDGGIRRNNLYEAVGGELRTVNVLPNGVSEPKATFGAAAEQGTGETPPSTTHAISNDGRRVVWTDLNVPTRLFLSQEGAPRSVELDAPQGGTGQAGEGRFWTASSDGSRVFFTDCSRLTGDSTAVFAPECVAEGENVPGSDLYEYNAGSGKLTDLTVDSNTHDSLGASVEGVVTAAEDGSYVYFVADGILAAGASGAEPHLYVRHDGTTSLIANLSNADRTYQGGAFSGALSTIVRDWSGNLAYTTARATPDGRFLVFMSVKQLTTRPTNGQTEVYLYSADDEQVTCVSCSPTGAAPSEPSALRPSQIDGFQPRWISDDGGRVFFDSKEALDPTDKNNTWDVYEYEHGTIHLISGGASTTGSYLDDATPSGSDVFFTTREALAPSDKDELTDLYDAREGGGFPELSSVVPCSGEACRDAQGSVAPTLAAVVSAGTASSGNLAPAALARPKQRALSRAQKLAKALKACLAKKSKSKRARCRMSAHKKYGRGK